MKEEEKKLEHFEKELDRALVEKQKLQMEIEEQRAAMEEVEAREAKLKNAAKQKDEELKVILSPVTLHFKHFSKISFGLKLRKSSIFVDLYRFFRFVNFC